MTYDRAVTKFDPVHMRQIHSDLIQQSTAATGDTDPEEP
jgi:hypothetical protein